MGPLSGKTYTQAQIDARDYSGVKPASIESTNKAIVGLNAPASNQS